MDILDLNLCKKKDVNLVLKIPLNSFNVADGWLWLNDKRDIFSVKSTYKLFMNLHLPTQPRSSNANEHPRKSIWQLNILSKIKIFLWKAIHDFLPTMHTLYKRGLDVVPLCPSCSTKTETALHSLFICKRAGSIWQRTLPAAPIPSDSLISFSNHLEKFLFYLVWIHKSLKWLLLSVGRFGMIEMILIRIIIFRI